MPPLSLPAVRAAMLEKLRSSLLTEQHAKILHLKPMTEADAEATKVINPAWAGFQIPYFTPEGAVDKSFFRYRFWPASKPSKGWASLSTPAKPLRYVQPTGSELHVYFPPPALMGGLTWREVMDKPDIDVNVTEGELKAACSCANGEVTLGLGGVFSWTSRRHAQPMIPILEEFRWEGRRVNLIFDSDKADKPLVQLAASRLALALLTRGARPYDVNLPRAEDGTKQGLDDYLATCPDPKEGVSHLLIDAKEVLASAELHRLNEEVAIIWSGGPAGNLVRFADGQVMTPQQFTRSFYKDRTYIDFSGVRADGSQAAPKTKFAAEEWLSWPCRMKVATITYAPGQSQLMPDGSYNLWQQTGAVPAPGSTAPWEDLLSRMFAGSDPDHLLWFRRWLAYPIQHPGTKLFNCVLLWSYAGGTGKNLLAEALIPVYGESNCSTIKSKHLTSDFNSWAEGKQFIIGDEITLDDKRHTSGDLKSMLTNRTVRINRKGIEAYEIPDCCNYIFTSNDPTAIVLEQGERRTFVLHAPEVRIGDEYGRRFKRWLLEDSGASHLAAALLAQDLGDFSPTAEPPDTAAKLDLIANSRTDVDSWAAALRLEPEKILSRRDPRFVAQAGQSGPFTIYTPEELLHLYDPEDRTRCSLRALGIALGRAGFRKATSNNGRLNNVRTTFWLIRNDDLTRAPISSTKAAKLYLAERPAPFHTTAATGTAKKKEAVQ